MQDFLKKWIYATPEELLAAAVTAVLIYTAILIFTRLFGLRSFSKMSGFDFAMTVAVGSLTATVIITDTSFLQGAVGLFMLYLIQRIIALSRRASQKIKNTVDNRPMLLMWNGKIIEENLAAAKVREDDVREKLRAANVMNFEHIRAVVFETTGDVTVLHSKDKEEKLDPRLLKNVKGLPEDAF